MCWSSAAWALRGVCIFVVIDTTAQCRAVPTSAGNIVVSYIALDFSCTANIYSSKTSLLSLRYLCQPFLLTSPTLDGEPYVDPKILSESATNCRAAKIRRGGIAHDSVMRLHHVCEPCCSRGGEEGGNPGPFLPRNYTLACHRKQEESLERE